MPKILFLLLFAPCISFAWCVKTGKANLRAGPGISHKVTWTAPKYTPLLEIGRKGNWIEVQDQDGQNHWVYGSSVTKKFSCASVATPSANLRTGPSNSAALAKLNQVDKYTPFKRLDVADNGWYKVESNWGGVYWIHPNLVWRPVKVRGVKM